MHRTSSRLEGLGRGGVVGVVYVASMLPFTRLLGRNQLLWQAYVWQDGAVPFRAHRRRLGDLTLPRQMAGLMSLEEHHVPPPSGTAPAGIQLTSFSKVTFRSRPLVFLFFWCLSPVASSPVHLALSCQFSCSAASSLWSTSSNLMLISLGGLGEVLDRYPDIEDLFCAGPICDLISTFSL